MVPARNGPWDLDWLGSTGGSGFFRALKKKAPRGNRPGFPGFFNPWNLWPEYIKASMESMISMAGWLDGWMVWFTTGYPQRDFGSTGYRSPRSVAGMRC